ncbi:MAG TPA: glycerol-3-phosphate dehydrogenase, partial [Allocoleopsis sp.]
MVDPAPSKLESLRSESSHSESSHSETKKPAQVETPAIVTILGAGEWGTALAALATNRGHEVRLWSRQGSLSLEQALANTEIVLSAISMKGVPETVDRIKAIGLSPAVILVSATKGLDPATRHTPAQIWQQAFPDHPV